MSDNPFFGKTKQLTLRLPEKPHRKLKILAACTGKSMTEIMTCCIAERDVRPIAAVADWGRQPRLWAKIAGGAVSA